MKMILAVINRDDSHAVIRNLTKEGYAVTKLSTTGGFLSVGNVTVLIGVEDRLVDGALQIIKRYSSSRMQSMPPVGELSANTVQPMSAEVTVGGATVFVMDVERFEKL